MDLWLCMLIGLVNKQLGLYEESLECFLKLQAIVRHHPQVLYQVAHLQELLGDVDQASEWWLYTFIFMFAMCAIALTFNHIRKIFKCPSTTE